ncbi:DUF389 domain-containing protein [Moheibacter lacus]|uniref:DUF389 domain-containing protein n=1 Tax=Moheibacter lacus TaxID=2745851 RepID=A0A838ZS54_9FLAO|nr:DUF389 domain-containing protein [Moheibacter lacus]MBA5629703.1 DUF389 domain-containing protein [Moheibacter lacus]
MTFRNKVLRFVSLHAGEEDRKKVYENVRSGISFRGSNLWILACAIVIASVGLNVNSTAVIIGAMLISPLMGPIVGAGFALGTYNFDLLKKSMRNLLISTVVGLGVSAIYFFISPFKETQSELLARTAPNIYDVMIAFFGGIVGVIAITRVEKGNPIPGVAIATALMPPLCTAGYGLAIGNFYYFLGAFYLYTINCFFICIATFLIIKYLKYQPVEILNPKRSKLIRNWISFIIIIMIVPSFYLAYNLYQQRSFDDNVNKFINEEFNNNGYTVIYKKTNFNSAPKKIEVATLTKRFDSAQIVQLNQRLQDYGLSQTELVIRQDEIDLKSEILSELNTQQNVVSEKDLIITNLQKELSVYKFDNITILHEIEILFPEMKNLSIGRQITETESDSAFIETVVIFNSEEETEENEVKLKKWLEQKLSLKNVVVINRGQ